MARSVKRRLGDPEPIRLGDVSYPVATLLGAQLRDVVQKAADQEGEPPERVVLAHPATWAPARRARFDEVARAAGVDAPRLVTARRGRRAPRRRAAGWPTGGIVAVYDLGGGGFEATVVRSRARRAPRSWVPRRASTASAAPTSTRRSCPTSTTPWAARSRELDMDDARTAVALARLRQDCVLAKETLSLDTETVVPVFLPGRHFEIRLNRTTFEQMLRSPARVDARRPVAGGASRPG